MWLHDLRIFLLQGLNRLYKGLTVLRACRTPRAKPCAADSVSALNSYYKILRPGMVDHNRRRTLLGLEQESAGQPHADVLLRLEQRKQLRLILQIRTRRIAKRIPRSAILLMKQIANVRRVFAGDASLFAHLL